MLMYTSYTGEWLPQSVALFYTVCSMVFKWCASTSPFVLFTSLSLSLPMRIYNLKRFCWWSEWNDRNDYDCDLQLVSYFYSSFSFKIYNHFGSISKKQVFYKSKSNHPALCFVVHLHIDQFPLGTGFFYLLKTCTDPKLLLPRMTTSSLICPFSSAISLLRSWYRVWLPNLPPLRNSGGKGEVPLKNDSCHKKANEDQNVYIKFSTAPLLILCRHLIIIALP